MQHTPLGSQVIERRPDDLGDEGSQLLMENKAGSGGYTCTRIRVEQKTADRSKRRVEIGRLHGFETRAVGTRKGPRRQRRAAERLIEGLSIGRREVAEAGREREAAWL